MTNTEIETADLVNVNDEALGRICYETVDGFYGVQLLGETRVDEWHPSQITLVAKASVAA